MNCNGQTCKQEEFRVVLVLPCTRMVLVEQHGETRRLPRISMSRLARTAERITELLSLRMKWAVRSFVIDILPSSNELPPCAVVEGEVVRLEARISWICIGSGK